MNGRTWIGTDDRAVRTDAAYGHLRRPAVLRHRDRRHHAGEAFDDLNRDNDQDVSDGEVTFGNGDMWYDVPPPGNTTSTEKADPREPGTVPWPWPKMVRITISIADPSEPMREQTFQFVVEIPRSVNDAPIQ